MTNLPRAALAIGLLALLSGSGCSCSPTQANARKDAGGATGSSGDGGPSDGGASDAGRLPDGGTGTTGGSNGGSSGGSNGGSGSSGSTGRDAGPPQVGVGPGQWVIDPDAGSAGVGLDPDSGALVLSSRDVRVDFAWIASASEGTISKIDTDANSPNYRKEIARYWAVIPVDGLGNRLPNKPTLRPGGAVSPSRTVVDLDKDMWVANRAPDGQGSVTKIASFEERCIDRNANGRIDTSHDINGDGVIDVNTAEFIRPTNVDDPATYDECVLFTQPVGTEGSDIGGRAISVDGTGDVWVGIWRDRAVFRLDRTDGHIKPVNTAGALSAVVPHPWYGAITDGRGRVWGGQAGVISVVNPANGRVHGPTTSPACSQYGIAVDGKDRIWLAGIGEEDCLTRFTPGVRIADGGGDGSDPLLPDGGIRGFWDVFRFTAQLGGVPYGQARGVAVDQTGIVWASAYNSATGGSVGRLIGLQGDTGVVRSFTNGTKVADFTALGSNAIGVGLASNDDIWINTYAGGTDAARPESRGRYGNVGKAVVVNRNSGAISSTFSLANGLYTYSDFTGYAAAKFTAPKGTWRQSFVGCSPLPTPPTTWGVLRWTAVTPAGTQLTLSVKSAATPADFAAAETFGPFSTSPVDLSTAQGNRGTRGVPNNPYLQVIVDMTTGDRSLTPALTSLQVGYGCRIGGQ